MFPFKLDAESVDQEVAEFQRSFFEGLRKIGEQGQAPSTGVTEREKLYEEDRVALYLYRSQKRLHTKPIVICYALVNRPYMLDLQEDRSLIRRLLEQGFDVYLIDWGYPERSDRYLTLNDYINGYLSRCIEFVSRSENGVKPLLLGVCQGGVLSLCYAAQNPKALSGLITMVTPVDFHTDDNRLTQLVRSVDVDLLVDSYGNIPGELLNLTFLSLKPYRLAKQKYVDVVSTLQDNERLQNFLRMEQWIFDSPNQAGEAFRQFIKDLYQGNKLLRGELTLGKARVDLGKIAVPVLNIYASDDHLVPPASSEALAGCLSDRTDYQELIVRGGHIGIYVGSRARAEIPKTINDWAFKHD